MKKERKVFVFCDQAPYVKQTRLCNIKSGDVFYIEEPEGSLNSDFGEILNLAVSDAIGVGIDTCVKVQPITVDLC